MIAVEKLSLFNIEHFRKLYNKSQNAYICNKGYFEIYDNQSFILKFVIRKQIRLFKRNNEYIGYIWFEYPGYDGESNIYSLYIKDGYEDIITPYILLSLNSDTFKFDVWDSDKMIKIMNNLQFSPISETKLMKMDSSNIDIYEEIDSSRFRHFIKKKDEKLRCLIQNSVFDDKDRIPITVKDIYAEEEEEYYLDNFRVFIYKDSDTIVGYGQVIFNNGQYTIANLGILEAYRGQGFGEELVRYLLWFCNKNSIKEVNIRVEKNNVKAISLYTKVGFKEYNSLTTWLKVI